MKNLRRREEPGNWKNKKLTRKIIDMQSILKNNSVYRKKEKFNANTFWISYSLHYQVIFT